MRKTGQGLALFVALLVLSSSAGADGPRNLTVNPETAPVRLDALQQPLVANVDTDLVVEARILNDSSKPIEQIEIKALILSAKGQVKGFYTFTTKLPLAPSEARFFVYRTSVVKLAPGDQVVALPIAARGPGLAWKIDREISAGLTRSLEQAAATDRLERLWAADNKPGEEGIEPPPQNYCNECTTRNDACRTDCRCGIQSFSCSCSNDSASSSCSCFQCPAQ